MVHKTRSEIARLLFLVGICLLACGVDYAEPEETALEASDLVGTWQTDYGNYDHLPGGMETLVMRADGTYQQVYEYAGYVYTSPWHKWRLERLSNGNVQVHLEGARYYLNGIQWAEDPEAMVFTWDPAADRRVELGIGKDFILNVRVLPSWDRSGDPGEVVLQHLPTGDLDAPEIVEFHRTPTLVVPTATVTQ